MCIRDRDLVRIVRTPEGNVKVDPTGKASGRGAYMVCTMEAFQMAKSKKLLNRALKIEITEEMYRSLEEELQKVVKK
jgi:predicted RNA-binding protein YlxR (DUF448 family)